MSQAAFSVDETPLTLPFSSLVSTLAAFNVSFSRKGQEIVLKDPHRALTGEMIAAVREHKAQLLILCDCRAELTRLHEYLIRLRCEDPPKGSRAQALAYLSAQIEKLAAQSVDIGGTEYGWYDPADVFADMDQIAGLRAGLAELTAEGSPYPVSLPADCVLLPQANFDPFAHGRLHNGRVTADSNPRT